MAMATSMPLGKVKDHLSEVVDEVRRTHERVTVTTHGSPAAVLIALDDLEGLEATLEVLSDRKAVAALRYNQEHRNEALAISKEDALVRWISR